MITLNSNRYCVVIHRLQTGLKVILIDTDIRSIPEGGVRLFDTPSALVGWNKMLDVSKRLGLAWVKWC